MLYWSNNLNWMSMNEDKSAEAFSYCSLKQSPMAVRVDHRITFSSASVSLAGIHPFIPCQVHQCDTEQGRVSLSAAAEQLATQGSISQKKQCIVSIPRYQGLGFFPRHNSAGEKKPSCKHKDIETPYFNGWQPLTPHRTSSTSLALMERIGFALLLFAEMRPPASNYFTPLNAFAAKPSFKCLFSLSLGVGCDFMSL